MKITKYSLGQLNTNCYILEKNNSCLIIDPADEASFILEELQVKKLKPLAILATHGHFDHVVAVGELQMSFNIPLYIFKKDTFLLKKINKTHKYFLGFSPNAISPKNIKYLKKGNMKIKDFEFKVMKTPGHTPGGCCFYFKKESLVFTGDTLFKQGIGRYDFSYCSYHDLKTSLKKLLKLPKNTIIYPGHGEESSIEMEKSII